MAYQWFGRIAENIATEKLKHSLEKAHIKIRPGAYISFVWLNTIIAGIVSATVCISIFFLLGLDLIFFIFLLILPILFSIIFYFININLPKTKAQARGKKIDSNLPYALNFISAMSSAGITPTEIFKSLSKQRIYGEIREESLWIYRDVSLLGKDIVTAIKLNIARTPSEKFKEFLQGVIITIQSGGALKPYFMAKADQYTRENRVNQKRLIESLGIMAEAYVTAAVAGVLLVIVIVPLLIIMSGAGKEQLTFMLFFIFVVVPMIHVGFAYILYSISLKV